MFLTGEATAYQGYIVYLVALVAFIKLGLAIWGNVAARKLHSPILSSLKILLHCLHSGHSIYPALHETAVSCPAKQQPLRHGPQNPVHAPQKEVLTQRGRDGIAAVPPSSLIRILRQSAVV